MATDNTHVPQTEDMSNAAGQEFNPEVVQIAQADGGQGAAQGAAGGQPQAPVIAGAPNGEVHVEIPAGQTVVRVQVAPGETIDLPFDGSLAARFGQQGNLAVKVGDQTIILLGYAEANQQEGVTLKNAKGEAIDVASVIAQTDPNLDIQTAAGPAAGPAGNQGGHLFFGFAGGNGLGGFGELGVINPTELQYKLIQPDENILVVGEAPSFSITFDITNGVVNEDDLHHLHFTHRGEGNGDTSGVQVESFFSGSQNPASAGLQDQLNSFFGDYSFKSRTGNDPFDTNDNENGSQNTPPLSDDTTDKHGHPVDVDREPLSATAHVAVNFHQTAGGTLTFDHNGDVPVIDALVAQGLTSHGNALSYQLLPATATHGESIVAYYEQGGCTVVVFSLEIQQPDISTIQGNFDVTYTIYGPLDNTGANAAEFDLHTIFFLTGNGSATFTESGPNDLVFRDIDDVPALGHFEYCTTGDGEGSGSNVQVTYDPANLTIGLDETPGVQHTHYQADANLAPHDKGDIDPTGALGQHSSQHTDDVCMTKWEANDFLHDIANNAASNPSDDATNRVDDVLGKINTAYLVNPGDASCGFKTFLGAAQTCLDVSFGADGKAQGSVDGKQDTAAGQTLFAKDGNATATAFELYMQEPNTATGAPDGTAANRPVDCHKTNVVIDVDNGDGTFTPEHVMAYQLDANTIIGIAFPDNGEGGDNPIPSLTAAEVAQGGNGTPVFMLHLDPQSGELTLIQYHSVENPSVDGVNGPNDPLNILTDDGQPLIHFRATDYDGDHVDAPLEVSIIDDAPVICKITYCSTGTEDHSEGHVDEDYLSTATNAYAGNHDHDTNPDNQNNAYNPADGNDGDGPGHTHVTGQIQVQSVDTPLTYSFNIDGLAKDGDTATFSGATTTAGDAITLTLTQSGNDWVLTGTDSLTHSAVFTVTLDSVTGSFSFDLQGSLHHPNTGIPAGASYEDDLTLDFGVKVKDSDGDPATGNLSFVVDDDAPKVHLCVIENGHVAVDESAGVQTDNGANDQDGPVPAIFNGLSDVPALSWAQQAISNIVSTAGSSFGADGPAQSGAQAFALHVSGAGVDSGLTTTDGHHIFLYEENGIVVGLVSANGQPDPSGAVAFAVSLDGSNIDLVQYLSLHNDNPNDPNDPVSIANGALQLTVSMTDGDGDTRSDTVSIGNSVEFIDDAPTAGIGLTNTGVLIDETPGVQPGSDDKFLIPLSLAVQLPAITTHIPMGYAQSSGAVISTATSSYGVDGPGHISTALTLSQQAADSGLLADNGQHIYLYTENGLVVGRIGSGDAADSNGTVAFILQLDNSGKLAIVQYEPINHPVAGDPNDVTHIQSGVLSATVTITDGDGDTSQSSVDLGNVVNFRDDGPKANNDYAVLDETLPSNKDFDGNPHMVTGNVVLGNSNDGILLNNSLPDYQSVDHNHTITEMKYGDTTIDLDFTKSNDAAITLGGGADASNVHFDSATGVLSFDTPYGHLAIVVNSSEGDPTLLNLTDKNALGYYEYTGAHNAIDTYYGIHQNGDGSTSLPGSVNALLATFGGVQITNNNGNSWSYKEITVDGKTYTGLGVAGGIDNGETDTNYGHAEQVTLKLPNAVSNATVTLGALFDGDLFDSGHLEVAQWQALDAQGHVIASGVVTGDHDGLVDIHIETDSPFSSIVLTPLNDGAGNSGNNSDFLVVGVNTCQPVDVNEQFTYTLTDADGDGSSANLNISVIDATPSIAKEGNTTSITLDEDGLPGGTDNNTSTKDSTPGDLVGGHNSQSEAVYNGGVFHYNVGADGFGSLTLNCNSQIQTIDGKSVIFAWDEATHQLIGYEDGDTSKVAVLVTLSPSNGVDYSQGFTYNVELLEPLQHPAGGNENNVSFDIQVQVEDGDCDVAAGNIHVTVNDDMPTVSVTLNLDREPTLETYDANTVGGHDVAAVINTVTKSFAGAFVGTVNYGADGAGSSSATYALHLANPQQGHALLDSGLSSGGHEIYLVQVGNTVYGTTDAGGATDNAHVAFTLSVDPSSGSVTQTQYLPLDHLPTDGAASNFNSQTIALGTGLVSLVDTVSATDADGDTVSNNAALDLGKHVTFADDGPVAHNDVENVLTQQQNGTFKADGNVMTGVGTEFPATGKDTAGADGAKVSSVDGVSVSAGGADIDHTYGSLHINPDGSYTYTVNSGVTIPSDATDVFTYTLTDGDGDTSTATLTIDFPHVEIPRTSVTVVGADGASFLKEDVQGDLKLTATPTEAADTITEIKLSNIPSNLTIDGLASHIALSNGTISSATLVGGVLTIEVSGATAGQAVTATVHVIAQEDSDLDGTGLSVTSTAVNGPVSAGSAPNPFTVGVDAVLDQYIDVDGTSQVHENVASSASYGLGLSANLATASFAHSGAGGADTDGSEHRSVTITLDSALPSGVTLTVDSQYGTVTTSDNIHFTLTPAAGLSFNDVASHIVANVPANFAGTISGTIDSVSTDVPTDTEYDTSDNTQTDSAKFKLEIDPHVTVPAVGVSVGGDGYFKEDVANTMTFTATPGDSTDHITTLTVTGLIGWTFNNFDAHGFVVSGSFASATGVLTLNVIDAPIGVPFVFTVNMTQPADSDLDASISISATSEDHGLTASNTQPGIVVVDAVLDEYLDVSGATKTGTESNSAQSINLGLGANLANAGFPNSGAGGSDTDGSEHRSVTLVLNAALPAGATLSVDPSIGTITKVDDTHYTLSPAGTHSYNDVAAAVQVNLPANYEGTISGTIQSTSAEAAVSGPGEPDLTDNSKSDSADFSVTVNPHVTAPTVGVVVEGSHYFKEDVANKVDFTATPQEPTDHITQIQVSGLTGWTVDADPSHIALSSGTVSGATFDAVTGTLTINVSGAADGTAVTAAVTMTPPEDSDVDGSITVSATAADHALTATSSGTAATLGVDAVLDQYVDVTGATQTATESNSGQSINLGLGATLASAGFTYSGQGGPDTDGSEHRTVTLTLGSALPSGATLSVDSQYGTVTTNDNIHFTLTPAAGMSYNDVASHIQVNVPANFEGTISGTIDSTSAEVTSGSEPDLTDNSKSDSANFSVTVNPHVTAPAVGVTVEGSHYFKEDVANVVDFTATPQEPTDHITQIVVTGLTGWNVDLLSISVSGGAFNIGSFDASTGTLTINVTGADGAAVTASVSMTPPADSDVDAAISVTATAADHALSATSSGTAATLVVDAVLDEYLDVSGATKTGTESNSAQSITLGLGASLAGAGFPHSGAGGPDTDGSEHRSVTLVLTAPLPAGATLSVDPLIGTVTKVDDTHYTLSPVGSHSYNDVAAAVQVNLPANYEGTISGSIQSTSAEAAVSGPGEPDMSDNSKSDSADFSVTIDPHVTAPTVGVNVEGSGYFKEDVSNKVDFTATPQEPTDHITQIQVSGLTGWTVDTDPSHITLTSGTVGSVSFAGGVLTINVTGAADGTAVMAAVTMTPPADSDVDAAITITATAVDHALSATSSGTAATLGVDAVLDQYVDVSGSTQVLGNVEPATSYGLGLTANLASASFPNSGAGGPDTDGSEHRSVTITLDNQLPAGVTLSVASQYGTVTTSDNIHFTLTPAAGMNLNDVASHVQANVPANFAGTISGTIDSVSTDTPTDTEYDTSDNTQTDTAKFKLEIDPSVTTPTVGVTVEGSHYFKEDVANVVDFTATPGDSTDHITQIAVSGLTGWTVDTVASHITLSSGTVDSVSFAGGVLTINVTGAADGTAVTASVTMTPPEDSDVDGSITVSATAVDHALSATSSGAASTLVVDAVLDDYLDVSGTTQTVNGSGSVQHIGLGLGANLANAGFTYSGQGGADTDGSEHRTVTLTLSSALPSGATLSVDSQYGTVTTSDNIHFTLTPAAGHSYNDVASHIVANVPGGFVGTISGTIDSTSAEVTSGGEPDLTDNSKSDSAAFSVTVNSANVPLAHDDTADVAPSVKGVSATNNVLIVLDLSQSMSDAVGNTTRLELAKTAIENLLAQYQNVSGVHLQIETFGITASSNGVLYSSDPGAAHTIADAISYVSGLNSSNLAAGTNYDAAIGGPTDSQSGNSSSAYNFVNAWGTASSTQSNTVYFISDGLPQSGSGSGSNAGASYLISTAQDQAWETLLTNKGAQSYAIGIDLGSNPNTTYLGQVASDSNHVITTASVDLSNVLGSISPVISTVTGNILGNDTDGGDGYHTPKIISFQHGVHTYAWDGAEFTVDGSTTLGSTVAAHNGYDITIVTADGGVFELNFNTGDYKYTAPATTVEESEQFVYTIEDAIGGDKSTATLTVHVVLPPSITSGTSVTVAENTVTPVYTVTGTDPHGATLTYSISGGADASLFTIDSATGKVSFVNAPDYENPLDNGHDNTYNITVKADDGTSYATKAVAITVTDVNEAPVITSGGTGTEAENSAISNVVYQTAASDPEGKGLTYSLTGTDASLFNISATGAVTFKSSPDFENPTDSGHNNVYDIIVNASDGTNTATKAVAISVTNVNEAPVITSGGTGTEAENSATSNVVYQAVTTDPEGQALTYSLTGTDASLFNISSTGAVTFKSSPDFENPQDSGKNNVYDIVVNASDGTNTTTKSVAVTVTNVNEAPVNHLPNSLSIAENSSKATISGLSVTDDATSGNLTVTLSVQHGTLSIAGSGGSVSNNNSATVTITGTLSQINARLGNVSYTPTTNYHGSDTLQMATNDNGNTGSGGAQTDTESLLFQVTGDLAPTVVPDNIYTNVASAFVVSSDLLTFNDTDPEGDALHVQSITSMSSHVTATVDPSTHAVTVDIDNTLPATSTFNYTANDGTLSSAAGTATVHYANTSTITGSGTTDDILIGGSGNDRLDGGGGNHTDHLFGGDGNDTLVFNTASTTTTYDGGTGFNTLEIKTDGASVSVNSTFVGNVHNIEAIDLGSNGNSDNVTFGATGSSGANRLSAQDVLDMSDSSHTLYIAGDNKDTVNILGGAGGWSSAGSVNNPTGVPAGTYDHYTATVNSVTVHLYVDHDIQLNNGTN